MSAVPWSVRTSSCRSGDEAVDFSDAGQLVEAEVGDHAFSGARTGRHRTFPPGEDRFAVQLLELQIKGRLVCRQEPSQLSVRLDDHEASLSGPGGHVDLGRQQHQVFSLLLPKGSRAGARL